MSRVLNDKAFLPEDKKTLIYYLLNPMKLPYLHFIYKKNSYYYMLSIEYRYKFKTDSYHMRVHNYKIFEYNRHRRMNKNYTEPGYYNRVIEEDQNV